MSAPPPRRQLTLPPPDPARRWLWIHGGTLGRGVCGTNLTRPAARALVAAGYVLRTGADPASRKVTP